MSENNFDSPNAREEKQDYQKSTYFLLVQLKEHIVQIESLITYLFFGSSIIYLIGDIGLPIPKFLVLLLLMICFKFVMKVTNPNSSIRNRLTWATAIGGFVGVIVGATTDILSGGLTMGQGTLIGTSAGALIGAAIGDENRKFSKQEKVSRKTRSV